MTRNIITAIFFVIFGILMMINLISCSDMFENPVPWPGDIEVEEPKYDLDNNVVKDQDQSPGALQKDNIRTIDGEDGQKQTIVEEGLDLLSILKQSYGEE